MGSPYITVPIYVVTWQQQGLCSTRTADRDTTGTRSTRNRNVEWAPLCLVTCFTAHPLQITHFWRSFLYKKLECRFEFHQNKKRNLFDELLLLRTPRKYLREW